MHCRSLIWIAVVAACAHPAPPQAPCPERAAVTSGDETRVPVEDDSVRRWKAVAAERGQLPAGTSQAAAIDELVSYLGSPDPVRRDEIAYTLLANWSVSSLGDAELRDLRARLLANVAKPAAGPDTVFERSFSVLVLASIVRRDVARPFMTDAERRELLAATRDLANRETDLRGWTGATGWAHVAAHCADLLAQLAQEPTFTDDDRAVVLDAVGAFITRRHGQILEYGEDGRLAVAIVRAARSGLARPRLDAWLQTLRAPLLERHGHAFDPVLFAAQRNARNLLFTLFTQASLIAQPNDGERQLLEAVRATLAAT